LLIDRQNFDPQSGFPDSTENNEIFLYCAFSGFEVDGRGFDGTLIGCKFEKIDWYWGLFNEALISKTRFVECKFRGTSFMGCRFLECEFERCEFVVDNVGGNFRFKDCVLVECQFHQCEFVPAAPNDTPTFLGTRSYGCTQIECIGLEKLAK